MSAGTGSRDRWRLKADQFSIRPARGDDLDVLWTFLAIAAHELDIAAAKAVPVVAAHLDGWRREGDFGVVAESQGRAVGAAWARQFVPEEKPTFYVDSRTPEVSIGVCAETRGQGVGQAMLHALIAESVRLGVGLCLNVRDDNPVIRLYERAGFQRVPGSEIRNRTGGLSFGMVLT